MKYRSPFLFAALVGLALVCAAAVADAASIAQIVAHPPYTPDALFAAGLSLAGAVPAFAVSSKPMRALQAKKAELVKSARALQDKFAAENRDPTPEEQAQFDALSAQIKSASDAIDREALLVAEEAALGVATLPDGAVAVVENVLQDPKRGFAHKGEFFQAVMRGSAKNATPDQRLLIGAAAPSTYGNESIGADGGFAVPPEFSTEIFTHSLGEDSLLPSTDNTPVEGNSMVFPKDETTPWGTDGIRAYWQSEASVATATKPKLSTTTLRLDKLMALVPITDELLADTTALGAYLPSKIGDSIRWKTNEAILFGSGNGTPLGAFSGNAAVVQAKDSGQATLTLSTLNVANMIARLPAGSYSRALWLINNNALPALFTLTLANYPIYLPTGDATYGGAQKSPYGNLLGRPVIVSQHAKSFTSQGDVLLVDLSYYRTITKRGSPMETAMSMHLYFDADATAFRTTFRVDGQPKIINPINPANGSTTMSPFVQLQAR
jgi:HK97 family phage major capsid protein